jgi:hypothetical protein
LIFARSGAAKGGRNPDSLASRPSLATGDPFCSLKRAGSHSAGAAMAFANTAYSHILAFSTRLINALLLKMRVAVLH